MSLIQQAGSFIVKKVFGELETKGWEELKSGAVSLVSNANPGTLAPTVSTIQTLNKYRSWVYPCVNLIKSKVSIVPYYLYQEVGAPNDEEFNRILDHPVVKLLKNPNRFQSGRLLKSIVQLHLDLCGFAILRIVRNRAGQPAELHVMNPHELTNIELGNNTNEVIKSFTFAPQFNRFLKEKIAYDDVLYFHYPHPANPFLPCTPIQALAHVTDLDLYLQVYEKDFFQNNARPDFVIIPGKSITPESAKRVSEGWAARHRGPGKQHKPAVLSEDVRIEQLSMSAKDFEFLSLSEWVKSHILAAYATPEAMFGLMENFNRASSITAETVWAKGCLEPRLAVFEDVINLQLLPQFRNTRGLEFKHETALPKDDEWELAKNQGELSLGLKSVNEIRKKDGYKPWPTEILNGPWVNGVPVKGISEEADKMIDEMQMGGAAGQIPGMGGVIPGMEGQIPPDVGTDPSAQGIYGQTGGRPPGTDLGTLLSDALRTSRPSLSSLLTASRGHRGGLAALMQSHPEMSSFGALLAKERNSPQLAKLLIRSIHDYITKNMGEEEKQLFFLHEDLIAKAIQIEEEYQVETEAFFVTKGQEIAGIVQKAFSDFVTKGNEIEDVDVGELKQECIDSGMDYAIRAAKIGFEAGYKLVKKAPNQDVMQQEAEKAAGRFLDYSSDLRVGTIKKNLIKIIREGIQNGEDSEGVADRIRMKFADISITRASAIARTEIAGSVDAGLDASYEKINSDAGYAVIKKAILKPAEDERVCEVCESKAGEVLKNYETGEIFYDSSVLHVNCRCLRQAVT